MSEKWTKAEMRDLQRGTHSQNVEVLPTEQIETLLLEHLTYAKLEAYRAAVEELRVRRLAASAG